jgi:flagellar biosynthesis/type III secretory pathway protein FliH
MSFISLVHEDQITLATNKLVFSAQEMGAIDTAAETATQLAKLFDEYDERIQQASRKGYEDGFNSGQDEGKLAARKEVAAQLCEMSVKVEEQRRVMRDGIIKLAILAVHKIAGKVGAPEMVASMALSAANELVVSEPLTLHVHPSVVDTVKSCLAEAPPINQGKHLPVEIKTDDALTPFDCILVSEHGETVASLDEQLRCLEGSWREKLTDSDNKPAVK